MTRIARIVMTGAFLLGALPVMRAQAQTEVPAPAPAAKSLNPPLPDPLPGLPRPPDQPASLMAPTASGASLTPMLPGPYFQCDPALDPPALPPPGWFTAVEAEAMTAHFKNRLQEFVQLPGAPAPNLVQVAPAALDWTVAPRVELGYRLPSGFGGFSVAYRGFATQGTSIGPAADGPAFLKSRLDLNEVDFDYQSWEFCLLPTWDMRWFVGGRLSCIYYDSSALESPAEAAAGSGIVATGVSNNFVGFGPHCGVELSRKIHDSGLAAVARVDMALELGRINQGFFEESTAVDALGNPLGGTTRESSSQAVPMTNVQVGASWQPPGWRDTHFFLGYEYEYWWNVGRFSKSISRGEMSDQGMTLKAEFNF